LWTKVVVLTVVIVWLSVQPVRSAFLVKKPRLTPKMYRLQDLCACLHLQSYQDAQMKAIHVLIIFAVITLAFSLACKKATFVEYNIDRSSCNGCGECIRVYPNDAVYYDTHGKAVIDQSKVVSYINNGCSDSELGTFYFISHQLRSQVQYSFAFDESMASYILIGGKYSPENDANAAFMEVQSRLVSKVYALAALKNQIDNIKTYQARVSYFLNPVSDFQLHYIGSDFSPDRSTLHYLGVGSSVYF